MKMISVTSNEVVLASASRHSLGVSLQPVAPAAVEVSKNMLFFGDIAGTGAFSEVFRVDYLGEDDPLVASSSTNEMAGSANDLPRDMALKRLKYKVLASGLKQRRSAAFDLLAEAKALSSLSRHDNIVSLYAVSRGFWDRPSMGFLLLEAVDETLDERLETIRCPNGSHAISPFRYHKRQRLLRETQSLRIQDYGLGIALALRFVHKNGMAYRDLKPTNVGIKWSHEGKPTVKLLDFGLVRPCTEQDSGISESSGTPRYMAPEVAQDLDHGLSSDVHSFAMVLWQICTLEKPYAVAVSSQFLHQLLVKEKRRPQLHRIQSNTIKDLLALAWHPDPNLRPTFDHITTVLQDTTK